MLRIRHLAFLCPCILLCGHALAQSEPTRYGPFGLFDNRSKYGGNWFVEPLLSDEVDAEQELRLNWFHSARSSNHADEVSLELEKSFDLLTLEIEAAYSREVESEEGQRQRSEGVGPIE